MIYNCYYSERDKNGVKMDLKHLNRHDDIIKVIEADDVNHAMIIFEKEYPNLVMIGINRYRHYEQVGIGSNCSMVKKLYKK